MSRFNMLLAVLAALVLLSYGDRTASYGRFKFTIPGNRPQAWVLVMGLTGAGKSSFIRDAVGVDSPSLSEVCHGMEPCTASVTVSSWLWGPKTNLLLVDTPGFDDAHKEDHEILAEIADDLADIYRSGIPIGAVIYLHRISDNRLQRGALRSISILREIVGRQKYASVVFATTWWDSVDATTGAKREAELSKQGNYWGSFIKGGAKVMRHNKGATSARNIMDEAIRRATSEPLQIQNEMVTEARSFKQTSAMLALESFEFLEKLQNGYATGKVSIAEYAVAIRDWMRRKNAADASFWDKHGTDILSVFTTVAQTTILGLTGGLTGGMEAILLGAVNEAAQRYFGWKSTFDSDDYGSKGHFEL